MRSRLSNNWKQSYDLGIYDWSPHAPKMSFIHTKFSCPAVCKKNMWGVRYNPNPIIKHKEDITDEERFVHWVCCALVHGNKIHNFEKVTSSFISVGKRLEHHTNTPPTFTNHTNTNLNKSEHQTCWWVEWWKYLATTDGIISSKFISKMHELLSVRDDKILFHLSSIRSNWITTQTTIHCMCKFYAFLFCFNIRHVPNPVYVKMLNVYLLCQHMCCCLLAIIL